MGTSWWWLVGVCGPSLRMGVSVALTLWLCPLCLQGGECHRPPEVPGRGRREEDHDEEDDGVGTPCGSVALGGEEVGVPVHPLMRQGLRREEDRGEGRMLGREPRSTSNCPPAPCGSSASYFRSVSLALLISSVPVITPGHGLAYWEDASQW